MLLTAWLLVIVHVANPVVTASSSVQPVDRLHELEEKISLDRQGGNFEAAATNADAVAELLTERGAAGWEIADAKRRAQWLQKIASMSAEARRDLSGSARAEFSAEQLLQSREIDAALAQNEIRLLACAKWLPDSPALGQALHRRAFILRAAGRIPEALDAARESHRLAKDHLEADHPEIVSRGNSVGQCLQSLGAWREADRYLREAYLGARRVLSASHPNALVASNHYAAFLLVTERWSRAESLARETVQLCREALGDDDETTVRAQSTLGAALRARGKLFEAEPPLRAAYETRRVRLGPGHPSTIGSALELALLLAERGRADRALPILQECRQTAVDPGVRPLLPTIVRRIAVVRNQLGQSAEARQDLERARRLAKELENPYELALATLTAARLFPADHHLVDRFDVATLPKVSEVRWAIELTRAERGLDHESEEERRRSLLALRRILAVAERDAGADHPAAVEAARLLATAIARGVGSDGDRPTITGIANAALARRILAPPRPDGLDRWPGDRGWNGAIELARAVARIAPGRDAMWRWLEAARLRQRIDQLARADVVTGVDSLNEAVVEEEEALFVRVAATHRRRTLGADDDDALVVARGEETAARARVATAVAKTHETLRSHFGWTQHRSTPEELANSLSAEEALLLYDVHDRGATLTVIDRDGEESFALADDRETGTALRMEWLGRGLRFRAGMTAADSEPIDTLLPERARARLANRSRWFVVPDGPIHGLPLEALFEVAAGHAHITRLESIPSGVRSTSDDPPPDDVRVLVVGQPAVAASDAKPTEKAPPGILLRRVEAGGNAHRAGLRAGDLMTRYAGVDLTDLDDLDRAIGKLREDIGSGAISPDARLEIGYWRNGRTHRGSIQQGRMGIRFDPSPSSAAMALLASRSIPAAIAAGRAASDDHRHARRDAPVAGRELEVDLIRRAAQVVESEVSTLTGENATPDAVLSAIDTHPLVIFTSPASAPRPNPGLVGVELAPPPTMTASNYGYLTPALWARHAERGSLAPVFVFLDSDVPLVGPPDLSSIFVDTGARGVVLSMWPGDPLASALFTRELCSRWPAVSLDLAVVHARTAVRTATRDEVIERLQLSGEEAASLPPDEHPFARPIHWARFITVLRSRSPQH